MSLIDKIFKGLYIFAAIQFRPCENSPENSCFVLFLNTIVKSAKCQNCRDGTSQMDYNVIKKMGGDKSKQMLANFVYSLMVI